MLERDAVARVPARTRVQSVPAEGETPQKYETIESILASAQLNRLRLVPEALADDPLGPGSTTGIAAPDAAALAAVAALTPGGLVALYSPAALEVLTVADVTSIDDRLVARWREPIVGVGFGPAASARDAGVRRPAPWPDLPRVRLRRAADGRRLRSKEPERRHDDVPRPGRRPSYALPAIERHRARHPGPGPQGRSDPARRLLDGLGRAGPRDERRGATGGPPCDLHGGQRREDGRCGHGQGHRRRHHPGAPSAERPANAHDPRAGRRAAAVLAVPLPRCPRDQHGVPRRPARGLVVDRARADDREGRLSPRGHARHRRARDQTAGHRARRAGRCTGLHDAGRRLARRRRRDLPLQAGRCGDPAGTGARCAGGLTPDRPRVGGPAGPPRLLLRRSGAHSEDRRRAAPVHRPRRCPPGRRLPVERRDGAPGGHPERAARFAGLRPGDGLADRPDPGGRRRRPRRRGDLRAVRGRRKDGGGARAGPAPGALPRRPAHRAREHARRDERERRRPRPARHRPARRPHGEPRDPGVGCQSGSPRPGGRERLRDRARVGARRGGSAARGHPDHPPARDPFAGAQVVGPAGPRPRQAPRPRCGERRPARKRRRGEPRRVRAGRDRRRRHRRDRLPAVHPRQVARDVRARGRRGWPGILAAALRQRRAVERGSDPLQHEADRRGVHDPPGRRRRSDDPVRRRGDRQAPADRSGQHRRDVPQGTRARRAGPGRHAHHPAGPADGREERLEPRRGRGRRRPRDARAREADCARAPFERSVARSRSATSRTRHSSPERSPRRRRRGCGPVVGEWCT